MTPDQLTAIRRDVEGAMAVREKASEGPWNIQKWADKWFDVFCVATGAIIAKVSGFGTLPREDAAFIAHSRTDPTHAHALELLDEVEKLQRELAELKGGA